MPRHNSMNWIIASVAAQFALLIYLQVHEWIHLPRWNGGKDNSQGRLDVILGVVQIGFIVGVAIEWMPAMALALVVYAAWLALQLVGWWIPYLRGASEAHLRYYERHWAGTWRFLPAIGDHPVPNAAHVILQALIVASLGTTGAALAAGTM